MTNVVDLPAGELETRIHGCWLGKSIGGTLGLPAEGRMERLSFTFYDPIPTEAPPNDDLELQLVWLHLLETRGFDLTQRDFADAWLAHIHYMWDEYGRCRWNLRRGVPIADVGTFENPFVSGMGSPIRSEIWACVCRGDADLAAAYATLDSSLDHGPEGIAGEIFLAVMQTLVLGGVGLRAAFDRTLAAIDPSTETARAIGLAARCHAGAVEAWACREALRAEHDNENFTHTPLNLGLIAWALLYGEEDFEKSILLAVNGGYDTDCTAATVGATLGLLHGADGIPKRWREPIGDGVAVGPGIVGIDWPRTLGELTARTLRLALRMSEGDRLCPHTPSPSGTVALSGLPGTILIHPQDGSAPVEWANGELPEAVKRAGGARWSWEVSNGLGQEHILVAIAKDGARLYVDDKLAVECPAGVQYVPAPHRCWGQAPFTPSRLRHEVRLELGSKDVGQKASVLLTSANRHLAPWSGEELPHAPTLPA